MPFLRQGFSFEFVPLGALVGASAQATPPDPPERRYALREVKARLNRASFRDAVLMAMGDDVRSHIFPNHDCSMRFCGGSGFLDSGIS